MYSVLKTTAQVNLCVYLQSLCCELFQSFEGMVKNCFDNSLSPHLSLYWFFWTFNGDKVIWKIDMVNHWVLFGPSSLMLLKSLNFPENKDFTVLSYKFECCRNTTSLLLITNEHCQLVAHCCILRSVTVQFVYNLFQTWKTSIDASKWPNYKKQTTEMNLASLNKQVRRLCQICQISIKNANCILAASGSREFGGHKIGNISLSRSSIATIFFFFWRKD